VTLAVYLITVTAAAVFLAASAWRAFVYARSPLHLRWELYPVPHEAPERVKHGGSYFEQGEWWRFPRRTHLVGELRFMVPEMLFLHALRVHNRRLWYRSFPFHFGLYLLAGAVVVLFGGAIAARVAGEAALPIARATRLLAGAAGLVGLPLAMLGAAGLLHRRLTDPALRVSTTSGDIFNLLAFVGAFGLLALGYVARGASAPGAFALATGIVSWDATLHVPPLTAAGIAAAALLAAYIPLTHMSHFVAKYFTYHAVRWDDEPLLHNRRRAQEVAKYLTYRPTWRAAHVRADGRRTWADVAGDNPAQESRR
jgi:nitrate reductase gamma subunit